MIENEKKNCPKCAGEMAPGIPLDRHHANMVREQVWLDREKLKQGTMDALKNRLPEGTIPVAGFRCKACGFLEFYAN